jgi:hypothetical protein
VRIKDDVGRMEDLLAKAQTTPGGKRRLGKLKIAAREFKK